MSLGTIVASLLSVLIAIAVVGALAFGFIYLLRIWQDRSMGAAEARGSGPGMRFLRALPLGQSERLVLVQVGDEVLLVGVAAHGVTMLKSWPREAAPIALEGEEPASSAGQLAARFRGIPGLRARSPERPEG